MYHPSLLSPQAKEAHIVKTQTSGAPSSVRHLLELDRATACSIVDQGTRASNIGMIQRGLARLAEIEEQLTILDAIDFGFIKPILTDSELMKAGK